MPFKSELEKLRQLKIQAAQDKYQQPKIDETTNETERQNLDATKKQEFYQGCETALLPIFKTIQETYFKDEPTEIEILRFDTQGNFDFYIELQFDWTKGEYPTPSNFIGIEIVQLNGENLLFGQGSHLTTIRQKNNLLTGKKGKWVLDRKISLADSDWQTKVEQEVLEVLSHLPLRTSHGSFWFINFDKFSPKSNK